jgi:hypothetical protein
MLASIVQGNAPLSGSLSWLFSRRCRSLFRP